MKTNRAIVEPRAIKPAPVKIFDRKITRIDLSDVWQTAYLCINLGCTHEELSRAVRQVGDSHAKVKEFIEEMVPPLW